MDRVLRERRQRDELEMDFDLESEAGESPCNSDDDFALSDEENDESEVSVHSDEDDIEPLEQNLAEENAANPENKYFSKNKKIEYSSQPFEINRRNSFRRAENFTSGKNLPSLLWVHVHYMFHFCYNSGPKALPAANIVDVSSAFHMFLGPVENIILNMTNLYGVRKYKDEWENIDLDTLHAYFGLLLLSGVYRSYGECVTKLWNQETGRPIFRATMSLKMFKRIHGCIRFDDREQRMANTASTSTSVRDKLAPIRNVYDKWNHNLKAVYTPGKNITVDEQLVPYRGRCPFRQYIPSKPAKYGIKIWVLCDSKSWYAYNTQIYVGRNRNATPERNLGRRVVLDLVEGLSDRNVTCDNFFTSYELAEDLHNNRMTILGTIRKNRTEIPSVLLDMRQKPIYHTEVVYEHKLQAVMLSYVPRRYRFVTLLSTYHNVVSINENSEQKKPNIIEDYNKTKSGVDTMDQMVATYTCKRKVNRWPMAVFCNMLDVSALNAFVTFIALFPNWKNSKTNHNIRRRLFIEELGLNLVEKQITKRKKQPQSNDASSVIQRIREIRHLPSTSKRGRCYICTYKNNKNLFATRCEKCRNFICAEHNFNLCEKCTNN